jgi:3-hydroxy-D-aspartate aldolase
MRLSRNLSKNIICHRNISTMIKVTCPAKIGDRLSEVETPALVVHRSALERNLQRMKDYMDSINADSARPLAPVYLRPHAKTHKCADVARLQIEKYGAVGICCQKLDEAEAMIDGGVMDILITNSIIGTIKIDRLCELAKRAKISVLVDDVQNVKDIREASSRAGAQLAVLIEVNGGQNRCGVNVTGGPGGADIVVALAREIAASAPTLTFKGIHCYGGFLQHIRLSEERRDRVLAEPVANARIAKDALIAAGINCDIVTGAGTGSYTTEVEGGVHNELQPGSYCFMDADYGNNCDGYDVFENALFIHTMVMSKAVNGATRAVLDAGLKALSLDSGPPVAINGYLDGRDVKQGVEFLNGGDEHGILSGNVSDLKVGDTVRLIPGHIDPTVNMHNFLVVVDSDSEGREPVVVAVWPIAGRGPGL